MLFQLNIIIIKGFLTCNKVFNDFKTLDSNVKINGFIKNNFIKTIKFKNNKILIYLLINRIINIILIYTIFTNNNII